MLLCSLVPLNLMWDAKMIRYCDTLPPLPRKGSHSNQRSFSQSTCLPLAPPPPITFTIKTFASPRQSLARSSFGRQGEECWPLLWQSEELR